MEMQNPSPPPKNSQVSNQQAHQEIMKTLQEMQQQGIDIPTIVQLGQFAEQAVKDQALYPVFTKALVDKQIAEPDEVQGPINYAILSLFVTLGKAASKNTGAM
jgi:hypothetical protein